MLLRKMKITQFANRNKKIEKSQQKQKHTTKSKTHNKIKNMRIRTETSQC